jgi:hypothetical protein
MIFPGQNSGNPWGPVGEHARVQGSNFPDGQYKLVLAAGDVNTDATVCTGTTIPVGSPVTTSGGTFDASFDWPSAANQVNSKYSICALKASDNSVASHLDSGPFTVLAANPPSLTLSSTSVTAGGSITASGQNWVPEQQVLVYAASCQSCGAPKTASVTVNSTGHTSGTFTATLTFPTSVTPGSYFLGAISSNGVLSVTEQSITVSAQPTATPAPSATATAAATATATQATGSTGSGGGDSGGLLIALGALAIVLLAALAGLIAYLVTRRNARPIGSSQGSAPGAYPTARPSYGVSPPPLPMPDELPRRDGWDPGATTAVPQGDDIYPGNYDDPTDPGLSTPRR